MDWMSLADDRAGGRDDDAASIKFSADRFGYFFQFMLDSLADPVTVSAVIFCCKTSAELN